MVGVEGEAVSICLGGAFRPQFSLKIMGEGGGLSSGSATERRWSCYAVRELSSQESSHKLYGFTFITI